jgi:cytoplasmic iron level regulating protein YaaA (DUF328/UPF0246 family)
MAYIISCSGKKANPILHPNVQPSTIENLSFNDELLIWRIQNIDNHNVILDWNFCLPAWKLYRGRLYSQIKQENWLKTNTEIIIISALFGAIKHTDLLPTYDLAMNGQGIAKFWREKGNLAQFINAQNDIDLLSKEYRKAFNNQGNPIANEAGEEFADRYGHHKGIWLNQQLNNL